MEGQFWVPGEGDPTRGRLLGTGHAALSLDGWLGTDPLRESDERGRIAIRVETFERHLSVAHGVLDDGRAVTLLDLMVVSEQREHFFNVTSSAWHVGRIVWEAHISPDGLLVSAMEVAQHEGVRRWLGLPSGPAERLEPEIVHEGDFDGGHIELWSASPNEAEVDSGPSVIVRLAEPAPVGVVVAGLLEDVWGLVDFSLGAAFPLGDTWLELDGSFRRVDLDIEPRLGPQNTRKYAAPSHQVLPFYVCAELGDIGAVFAKWRELRKSRTAIIIGSAPDTGHLKYIENRVLVRATAMEVAFSVMDGSKELDDAEHARRMAVIGAADIDPEILLWARRKIEALRMRSLRERLRALSEISGLDWSDDVLAAALRLVNHRNDVSHRGSIASNDHEAVFWTAELWAWIARWVVLVQLGLSKEKAAETVARCEVYKWAYAQVSQL